MELQTPPPSYSRSWVFACSEDLMEVVFSNPYCRIRFIEESTGVARQTASTYLKKLADLGLLQERKIGREVYYINQPMIEILSSKG
jgi:Fic family protein